MERSRNVYTSSSNLTTR